MKTKKRTTKKRTNKLKGYSVYKIAEFYREMGLKMWKACLFTGLSSEAKELFDFMCKINLGDFVMETSTQNIRPAIDCIGTLLEKEGPKKNGFHTFKIKSLDRRIITWSNCRFVRIASGT